MTWALHYLTEHPEVLSKLRTELEAQKETHLSELSEGKSSKKSYFEQVINETLRAASPVPFCFARQLPKDREYQGYTLPSMVPTFGGERKIERVGRRKRRKRKRDRETERDRERQRERRERKGGRALLRRHLHYSFFPFSQPILPFTDPVHVRS